MGQDNHNELKCDFCSHVAQPILLRIHMFQTHKQFSAAEIDLMMEGKIDKNGRPRNEISNKIKEIQKEDSRKGKLTHSTPNTMTPTHQNKIQTPQIKSQTPQIKSQTPQNKTISQDIGPIKCLAPRCKKMGKMFNAKNMHK